MKKKSEQTMKQKLMTVEKMRRCYAELLLVPSDDEENYPYDEAPAARVTFLMDRFNCLQSHATLLDSFIRGKEKFGLDIVGQVDLSKLPSDDLDDLQPGVKWLGRLILTSSEALKEDHTKREKRFYDDIVGLLVRKDRKNANSFFVEPLVAMLEGRIRRESGKIDWDVTPLIAFQTAHYGFGKSLTRGEQQRGRVLREEGERAASCVKKTKSIKNISR